MAAIVEFESLMDLTCGEVKTRVEARHERKARQAAANKDREVDGDRYIPHRGATGEMDENSGSGRDSNKNNASSEAEQEAQRYAKLLALNSDAHGSSSSGIDASGNGSDVPTGTRVLAFKNKAPAPKEGYQNSLKV